MGGFHLFKKPNTDVLKNVNFDVLMHEGVDSKDSLSLSNILREPFFILYFYLWIFVLRINSKLFVGDMQTLENFAKQHGKPVHVVDATLNDLIDFIYTPFNLLILEAIFSALLIYIVYLGQFRLLLLLISPYLGYSASWAVIVIIFIFSCGFYFSYVAWRTTEFRNKIMVKKMISLIKEKDYKCVIFYAGSLHKKAIFNLLKNENLDVQMV
jgi:hypothetical protein